MMIYKSLLNGLGSVSNKIMSTYMQKFGLMLLAATCCLPSALSADQFNLTAPGANAIPIPTGINPNQLVAPVSPSSQLQIINGSNAEFSVQSINSNMGRLLNIRPFQDNSVIEFESFDIGSQSRVDFQQLSADSITVARVSPTAAPSQIFGMLTANGRVFLINPNGILFGEGAQINVNELVASTLNITELAIEQGILAPLQADNPEAVFRFEAPTTVVDGALNKIEIQEGATITAGERVILLAQDIENNGEIIVTQGQVILGAGGEVFIDSDPSIRGLRIAVNNGGTVVNNGTITTPTGNTTLIGSLVRQNGTITATTSVNLNGTIRLIGGDNVETNENGPSGSETDILETNGGEVVLGSDSVTQILAELDSDETTIDAAQQPASTVEINGERILLEGGSQIIANSGRVDIVAQADPNAASNASGPIQRNDNVVVQIEAGATIDVSGNTVSQPASANNIELQLRGNELRDLPLQRNGTVSGQDIVLDIRRLGEFRFGDVSGFVNGIQRTVGERTTTGGVVNIMSEGDIRFLEGATIDVSGGAINFESGQISTTLLRNGRGLVDIHDANPAILFDGIDSIVTMDVDGFVQGADAGTVQLSARRIIADGNLLGNVSIGRFQRLTGDIPQGGELIIGNAQEFNQQFDFLAPNIVVQQQNLSDTANGFSIGIDESFEEAGLNDFTEQLLLSDRIFTQGGFTRARLNSNGNIRIASGNPLNLSANSQLSLNANSINIDRSITSPGGNFNFESSNINVAVNNVDTATLDERGMERLNERGVFIGSNVALDVSGNFTNDQLTFLSGQSLTSPVILDAGSIRIASSEPIDLDVEGVALGDNVTLSAIGGARVQSSGDFEFGSGGDITIETIDANLNTFLRVGQNNRFLGFGNQNGGTFNLTAGSIRVSDVAVNQGLPGQNVVNGADFVLPDFFFAESGFSNFNLQANNGDLVVESNAIVDLINASYFLPTQAFRTASTSISQILGINNSPSSSIVANNNSLRVRPSFARNPTNLSLSVTNDLDNNLVLQQQSIINADPGATINLNNGTGGVVALEGRINAKGSNINVRLTRQVEQLFDNTQGVILGEQSFIDISGTTVAVPDRFFNRGRVIDAGNLDIESSGFIVAENGARIDANGVGAVFDVTGGLSRQVTNSVRINGRAGSVRFGAAEGIIDQSNINLSAASPTSFGGELSYELDNSFRGSLGDPMQTNDFVTAADSNRSDIVIMQDNSNVDVINDFAIGDAFDANNAGRLEISANRVQNTNADSLNLTARAGNLASIQFDENVSLNLERNIVLDSPVINLLGSESNVNLQANYIALGADDLNLGFAQAITGNNQFTATANLIDLIGVSAFQNTGTVNLRSNNDIRLIGPNRNEGELLVDGAINLTADQIFPATFTEFTLNASDTGSIAIASNNESTLAPVLSANGSLRLRAATIEQGGVLRAPAGEIIFDAEDSITLSENSITSVSANGQTILFGQANIQDGLELEFNGTDVFSQNTQQFREKNIVFDGDSINIEENAVVDVSGGGDLINFQFIPGPGGSVDALLAANAGETLFAVIPSLGTGTPFDAQEFADFDFEAGESVFLAGGNGLAAGFYTKLPPRYALLPGAFLIEQVATADNLPLNQSLAISDGGVLVGGFTAISGTGIREDTTTGFIIREGSFVNQLSEFNIRTADDVITEVANTNNLATPSLGQDAGRITFNAGSNISLAGEFITNAVGEGRGAIVDITSNFINIVSQLSSQQDAVDGVTELLDTDLNNLNAETLLVGGTRDFTEDGTVLSVTTENLSVNEGVELQAPEIILVATNGDDETTTDVIEGLSINSGASLNGSGAISTNSSETILLDGDSSLVRVSSAPQVNIQRTNTSGTASLTIADGSNLSADGSITLDSSGDLVSGAQLGLAQGAELGLGASAISVGDAIPENTQGVLFDQATLDSFNGLALSLRTDGTVNFFGDANINVDDLNIDAVGIIADQSIGMANIDSNSVNFSNSSNNSIGSITSDANGSLNINTVEFNLREGEFTVDGFNDVTANVDGRLLFDGNVDLTVRGNFEINTPVVTATSGTNANLTVEGAAIFNNRAATQTFNNFNLGSNLSVQADEILLDTVLKLPVGLINLAAANDVSVGANAAIDLAGVAINVIDLEQIDLPGGVFAASSENGNIRIANGSTIDVQSGGENAVAGQLVLEAGNGDVTIEGNLIADSRGIDADEQGGRFTLDSRTIGANSAAQDFSSLNNDLNSAGFTGSRRIRQREGDINIASTGIIRANEVELIADGQNNTGGNINIDGTIQTTDSEEGGSIALFAQNDLNINTGSVLDAAPTVAANDGDILLSSAQGLIDVNTGSTINAGNAGSIRFRASQSADNTDINISELAGNITAADITLEAVDIINSANVTFNAIQSSFNRFMTADNIAAISASDRLNIAGDSRFNIQAGVEFRNDGDITINQNGGIDLSDIRFGDTAPALTIRASGDVNINSNISDGIVEVTSGGFFPVVSLLSSTGESSDINIISGADNASGAFTAGLFEVNDNRQGSVALANDTFVRTGTGDINVVAANNIEFGNDGSTIYTLGRDAGFNLDRRDISGLFGGPGPNAQLVPVDGGDITLVAMNDIVGARAANNQTQFFAEFFQLNPGGPAAGAMPDTDRGTFIDFNNFRQGIAAFGGGDVNVTAGNNISQLSVSAPTTIVRDFDTQEVTRRGEGDITITAGGDILDGIFFIGDGDATLRARGDIGSSNNGTGLLGAVMGGSVDIQAVGNVDVARIFDPTFDLDLTGNSNFFFSSFTEQTSTNIGSIAGNLNFGIASGNELIDIINDDNIVSSTELTPSEFSLSATTGDVVLVGTVTTLPATEGNISVFADGNISIMDGGNFTLAQSDAPLAIIPTIDDPLLSDSGTFVSDFRTTLLNTQLPRASEPLLGNDERPNLFVAQNGDIEGGAFNFNKATRFFAGRDINNINFNTQNINANDLTRVQAGRNINNTNPGSAARLVIAGPGRFEVIAGGDIDLGQSDGIQTIGNLNNGNLADVGADIFVLAGVGDGPQYLNFFTEFFSEGTEYRANLLSFLAERFATEAEVQNFLALTPEQQLSEIQDDFIPTIFDAYYAELNAAGTNGDFVRGFRAIDVLFPESQFDRETAFDPAQLSLRLPGESTEAYFARLAELSDYDGDLTLFASRIVSRDGGDINFSVPGGFVNAGLPLEDLEPNADPLGIIAFTSGAISGQSRGGIEVNTNRISTLAGGDILLFSSTGDIDAGRGAQSAISAPPAETIIADNGTVTTTISNAVSGSGIQAVVVEEGVDPTSVNVGLFAPNGAVDAGDAGIATSGNLIINAQAVIGADNINVGGVAIGVPSTNTGSVSTVSLAPTNTVPTGADEASEDALASAEEDEPEEEQQQLSFISVEVLGFGYDDEEAEDDAESAEISSVEVEVLDFGNDEKEDKNEENAEVSQAQPVVSEDLG